MNIKVFILISFVLAGFTGFAQDSKADKKQKEYDQIQHLIDSKNFVFAAQSVLPMRGRTINLTSSYNVTISPETVVSDLPYFGRAFVAPVNPSEGGIHFTSTKFDFNIKDRKKGGWDIAIAPKDTRDVRQMFFTITENGNGTLQVISNNRQQISYNGYIKEIKG